MQGARAACAAVKPWAVHREVCNMKPVGAARCCDPRRGPRNQGLPVDSGQARVAEGAPSVVGQDRSRGGVVESGLSHSRNRLRVAHGERIVAP
jgi:hypothetical protein